MTFTMLVGLPGSGKSTFARSMNAVICSSDQIREEFNLTDNNAVFAEMDRQVRVALKAGNDVVYDATNLNRKRRINYLKNLSHFAVRKKVICFVTPFSICKEQNMLRDEKWQVPDSVYDKFIRNFQMPAKYEGWDVVKFIFDNRSFEPVFTFEKANVFDQENSHHVLTLGEHLLSAERFAREHGYDDCIVKACRYHDIGKLITKSFLNSKGEITDEAHFYGHDNASAYLFLSEIARNTMDDLHTANLINWHMQPFNWNSDMTIEKVKALIGEKMFEEISMVHQADVGGKT